MADFKVVSKALVRKYLKMSASFTTDDDIIDDLINGVTEDLEQISGRGLELKERTEYFDVENGTDRIKLGAWPVSASPLIDIRQDTSRAWGTTAAVATTSYYLDSINGVVLLYNAYPISDYSIKVVYTGGTGGEETSDQFAGTYSSAARVVVQQVVYEYRNLKMIGKSGVDVKNSRATSSGRLRLLPLFLSTAKRFGRGPMD